MRMVFTKLPGGRHEILVCDRNGPFQIATDDQEETDRFWNAIVGIGGKERDCGWC